MFHNILLKAYRNAASTSRKSFSYNREAPKPTGRTKKAICDSPHGMIFHEFQMKKALQNETVRLVTIKTVQSEHKLTADSARGHKVTKPK